jgi:hypothetical protein
MTDSSQTRFRLKFNARDVERPFGWTRPTRVGMIFSVESHVQDFCSGGALTVDDMGRGVPGEPNCKHRSAQLPGEQYSRQSTT